MALVAFIWKFLDRKKWENEGARHLAHVLETGIEPQMAALRAVASAYGASVLTLYHTMLSLSLLLSYFITLLHVTLLLVQGWLITGQAAFVALVLDSSVHCSNDPLTWPQDTTFYAF